jgi:hypothetical protein
MTMSPEVYTPERKAEFLLSNAVDVAEYQAVRETAVKFGLDPDKIPHLSPS